MDKHVAPPRPAAGATGRTAFVLTGGGSLGAVQVGMLTALFDHGVEPHLLVGTSVGAVNAAYLAGPGTTGRRLASLGALWEEMRRRDVFVAEPRRWLRAALGGVPSIFSAAALRLLLATHLGYDAFEDARLELAVTATDVVTGAAVLLGSGSIVDAVAASAAVPGLLPPVRIGDRTLVDGAVGHAGALAYADARGADDIYLLPAGYPCAGRPATSALGVGLTALNLLLHRQLLDEVRSYSGAARLHIAPPLCPLAISPADFAHADVLRRRAYASTREWLDHGPEPDEPPESVLALHGPHEVHHKSRPATASSLRASPARARRRRTVEAPPVRGPSGASTSR